ncbi:arsenate reductase [Lampropedia puyangensis]|uniref:Arsenate reductase n=1 Tax=Lampropedia puyangensis TaxID=1330072 RepID=A0A4S8EYD8_9BURK|nr:arsenate reductase [Lampropedia puyangensis]THT99937.1 arsenate reductase [Lampropedia puyangensis]
MTKHTVRLYGIPNCDTVKKSRQWFADHGIEVQFHDFKKQGLETATMAEWAQALGVEVLLNRKGTTWRQFSDSEQAMAATANGAQALMLAHTSSIKRPVVQWGGQTPRWTVGFVPEQWQVWLAEG